MGRKLSVDWYVCEENNPKKSIRIWDYEHRLSHINYWVPENICYRLVDGRWTDTTEFLFPNYLFLCSDRGPSYIENILDVSLVKFGKKYHILTYKDVCEIRSKEAVCEYKLDYFFKFGDSVIVKEDARSSYAGFSGNFITAIKVEFGYYARVELSFNEFEKSIECIPYDHLEPCIKENLKEVKILQER